MLNKGSMSVANQYIIIVTVNLIELCAKNRMTSATFVFPRHSKSHDNRNVIPVMKINPIKKPGSHAALPVFSIR